MWNKKGKLCFHVDESRPGTSRITDEGGVIIETIPLDEALNGKQVTFIKMDIEGAEYKALLGSKETIKKWRPRLAICLYHKAEDILEIPALLLEIQPEYNFALRQYNPYGGETILYAY